MKHLHPCLKDFLTFLVISSLLLGGCHSNKSSTSMIPSRVESYSDLLELFPEIHLPYHLNTDTLDQQMPDSMVLTPDVAARFFPDTLTRGIFRHRDDLSYYPIGKIRDASLTYLLLKVSGSGRTAGLLCTLDKTGKFLGRMLVAQKSSKGDNTTISMQLDKQYNITVTEEQRLSPGKALFRERVYGANATGGFSLILINSNEPINPQQLYNPIDSLPSNHRFSGDYTAGHMNLVSIRDAKGADFKFFIHFSQDRGNCTGEVDGTGHWLSAGIGQFKEKSGPCTIQFKCSGEAVVIKELGGCAAYRGMNCQFSGGFHKKKVRKSKIPARHYSGRHG